MKLFITLAILVVYNSSLASDPIKHNCGSSCGSSWGFYGHKRINRMAVFTLPPELFTFYKEHVEFITDHAPDPDKRRYAVKDEAARHYIDIDHYVKEGEDPFEVVPKRWKDAVEKFSEDTLKAYGIVPWHIQVMLRRLTKAFKEKNLDRILHYSADIGHYIGDANVPLHTTENYNGQMTNQKGIHGFWESRIPELSAESYDYLVGRAEYVSNPLDAAWEFVKTSHVAVDSVLRIERELTEEWDPDKKYNYEHRGQVMMKVYSVEFAKEYERRLGNMQERRMRNSIISVGSFWYTAWVNAGQPDLTDMQKDISEEMKEELKKTDDSFKKGKIYGREHDN